MIFRLEKACSGSKGNESRLKLDIFNPKMLHNCPHALGDNSNPIVGHRWSIDAHRKKLRWPSMGHRWPIDGIEWSLSTGYYGIELCGGYLSGSVEVFEDSCQGTAEGETDPENNEHDHGVAARNSV